jgi:hypothetical protein
MPCQISCLGLFVCVLALISTCKKKENFKRLRGTPLIRGKSSEKSWKSKINPSEEPVDFLNSVLCYLTPPLNVVFENIDFKPTKII